MTFKRGDIVANTIGFIRHLGWPNNDILTRTGVVYGVSSDFIVVRWNGSMNNSFYHPENLVLVSETHLDELP